MFLVPDQIRSGCKGDDFIKQLQVPVQLMVADLSGRKIWIPWLEPGDAWKTLEVQLVSDGNSNAEFQYLHLVAKEWQAKILKVKIAHTDAKFSLWGTIL